MQTINEQALDEQARNEIVKQRNVHSDKISTQVRTISFGALATSWGLIISNSTVASQVQASFSEELLKICILSIMTLFFDFLQYLFGYLNLQKRLRKKTPIETINKYLYDHFYWTNYFFFWTKQISTAVCVIWLVTILWRTL